MAIADYATLQTRVASLLNRDDLTADIPGFIELAEDDMNRKMRHWRMEVRATAPITTQYVELPADWIQAVRLTVVTGTARYKLELASQADMARMREGGDAPGIPIYYAFTGGQIEVYPTPSEAMTIEMVYLGLIPALSDINTSNWVLAQASNLYLYGAALHSAPWLRDDPRLATWDALFNKSIDDMNLASKAAAHSGTGLRMKLRSV